MKVRSIVRRWRRRSRSTSSTRPNRTRCPSEPFPKNGVRVAVGVRGSPPGLPRTLAMRVTLETRTMSQAIEVKVPDIGAYKDIPVIEVLVAPGDTVEAEQSLLTLESDKATMDVPSPSSGVVKEVKVKVGDTVSEGTLIVLLE